MIPILKPSKKVYTYDGIPYASKEEIYFVWYLDELFTDGYIAEYDYQPEPFSLFIPISYNWIKQLKTKKKEMTTTLLRAHSYQADFKIIWNAKAYDKFFNFNKLTDAPFIQNYGLSWIDVKPSHDMQNMTRLFHINQKWVHQRHGVYVQKIVPQELFAETFTPGRYRYTDKSLKPRKIDFDAISLSVFDGSIPF
jgi:hypothetical protein